MSEFTKGPWSIVECDGYQGIANVDGLVIASAYARVGISEMKANAKLIAAAPRLLEVLERHYVDAIDRGETEDEDGNEFDDYREIREVIAMAKGE